MNTTEKHARIIYRVIIIEIALSIALSLYAHLPARTSGNAVIGRAIVPTNYLLDPITSLTSPLADNDTTAPLSKD